MDKISVVLVYFLSGLIFKLDTTTVPSIRDVFLQPLGFTKLNVTVLHNSTCQQCICEVLRNINSNYSALNCFTNGTCEFFPTFPLSYKLKPSMDARFYFFHNTFPDASNCCVPNITELLLRLQNLTPNIIHLIFQPSAFGYDENVLNEAAVIGMTQSIIYWFNPITFTFLRNASVWTTVSLALYNNAVFTAIDNTPTIYVLDNTAKNQIINITDVSLLKTRKYIFLNNGQTMIVTAQSSNALAVFNVNAPTNYTLQVSDTTFNFYMMKSLFLDVHLH